MDRVIPDRYGARLRVSAFAIEEKGLAAERAENYDVAVHESRVTSVQKDPRSNMGHAIVRSNWMGATTAPGWR